MLELLTNAWQGFEQYRSGGKYIALLLVVLLFFWFLLLFSYLPYAYLPVQKNKKNGLTVSFIVLMSADFFKTIFHSLRLVDGLVDVQTDEKEPP